MSQQIEARLEALEFTVSLLLARNFELEELLARRDHIERRYASDGARKNYQGDSNDVWFAAIQVRGILFLLDRAIHRRENQGSAKEDDLTPPPLGAPSEFK